LSVNLSKRELEIVGLLRQGLSNREIALELFLSLETIKWYNNQIYSKLGVNSRTQAVAKADQIGLFDRSADSKVELDHATEHILNGELAQLSLESWQVQPADLVSLM
jgi:DNA-binding CsgD family transcriptional regulator